MLLKIAQVQGITEIRCKAYRNKMIAYNAILKRFRDNGLSFTKCNENVKQQS